MKDPWGGSVPLNGRKTLEVKEMTRVPFELEP